VQTLRLISDASGGGKSQTAVGKLLKTPQGAIFSIRKTNMKNKTKTLSYIIIFYPKLNHSQKKNNLNLC